MEKSRLEIPEGAIFELEADGLVIGFKDDVIIRGPLGQRVKKVWSEQGNIEMRASTEVVVETLETKRGMVIVAGAVRAKSIKGMKIQLLEGTLAARSLNAEQTIELKGGVIEADLLISPTVLVSPQVRGRATVIESQNEIGPHALKGGFRMTEFMEMVPSAQKVIQSEAGHFPALGAARQPASSSVGIPPRGPATAPAGSTWSAKATVVAEDEPPVESTMQTGAAEEAAAAAPAEMWGASEGGTEPEAEAASAADGGTVADEPAPAEPPMEETSLPEPEPPPRPAFHNTLAEMCAQITRVYTAQNLQTPPPVARLTALVEAGEYATVKAQLTSIWNQLIQYHKESKLPFAVKTTQMFQSIQRTLAANV